MNKSGPSQETDNNEDNFFRKHFDAEYDDFCPNLSFFFFDSLGSRVVVTETRAVRH
jgi:hypothetical protein